MKHITVLHILKSKSLFLLNHEDNDVIDVFRNTLSIEVII